VVVVWLWTTSFLGSGGGAWCGSKLVGWKGRQTLLMISKVNKRRNYMALEKLLDIYKGLSKQELFTN